ncbi:hypothetical protein ABS768_11380 [Flavobacterium sp. ST-75]|uniref:DUF2946 domain-containing protein n=1 Tax=Flavobacterium rhizophilum TaxID=3163296 RepID=A0ABW8YD78_9FLAO
MKRKFALFNLSLMALVLLTTGFQSFHAFSHQHHATAHHHNHNEVKQSAKQFSGIEHPQSHEDDDCSICNFHFDFFVAPPQFCLRLDFPFKQIHYTFSSIEGSPSFAGSLFAHRGPPAVL